MFVILVPIIHNINIFNIPHMLSKNLYPDDDVDTRSKCWSTELYIINKNQAQTFITTRVFLSVPRFYNERQKFELYS